MPKGEMTSGVNPALKAMAEKPQTSRRQRSAALQRQTRKAEANYEATGMAESAEGDIWGRFIILSSERRRHGSAEKRTRLPRGAETSLAGVGVFPYNPMDLCIPKFCNERDLRQRALTGVTGWTIADE